MPLTSKSRPILQIIGIIALLLAVFWIFRGERRSYQNDIQALKRTYDDSVAFYIDRLGSVVASKEVVEIEFHQLKELDSAKYTELEARYEKRLRQVAGSSTITIKHDTVKVPQPFRVESTYNLGLIEYKDSCLYAGLNFTDSGTYMNYLIASYDITSTFIQDGGLVKNDISLNTKCGQVAQVKTFVFAPEPKKWFQKPLVVGGVGLGVGTIVGIIIAK